MNVYPSFAYVWALDHGRLGATSRTAGKCPERILGESLDLVNVSI